MGKEYYDIYPTRAWIIPKWYEGEINHLCPKRKCPNCGIRGGQTTFTRNKLRCSHCNSTKIGKEKIGQKGFLELNKKKRLLNLCCSYCGTKLALNFFSEEEKLRIIDIYTKSV
ncbi:hypothetical protein A2999_01940 [Candidatus Wolfebacteria bacterium RIFCSPLOWO2_01_FULL_38_11]|uniref:Uncharacterized protein n=1 Tax=Candidatus Wolfebacteria bacterium RIFCSPLOWO2_01_FULL_38_11 TaxID=1802556 RepID=A0A1F8DQ10_9BACT|nr:MAG: hypothetical protein A2999_01940 [Candidatus Wolfebacteria bacterium RIFCSPLOWO2_01_FULL_38_11]